MKAHAGSLGGHCVSPGYEQGLLYFLSHQTSGLGVWDAVPRASPRWVLPTRVARVAHRVVTFWVLLIDLVAP